MLRHGTEEVPLLDSACSSEWLIIPLTKNLRFFTMTCNKFIIIKDNHRYNRITQQLY